VRFLEPFDLDLADGLGKSLGSARLAGLEKKWSLAYVEKGRHSRTSRIERSVFDGRYNHNRISVFTRSPAENDILFTNVNVEIDKNNLVVDSESVDAPSSPENSRYPCSSRLGVTYHPYHPYTPCAARTKTSTPPRHSGSTKKPPLTVPESPHCTDQIGGGIGTGKRG